MKIMNCIIAGILSVSSLAQAGSATVTCKTKSKDISFSVGNYDGYRIRIQVINRQTGKPETYETGVGLMPEFSFRGPTDKEMVMTAIPVGAKKFLNVQEERIEGVDGNGAKCSGRDIDDVEYVQTMVLTQQWGNMENMGLHYDVVSKYMVPSYDEDSGYITAEFICYDSRVSSGGGCGAGE